MNEEIDLLGALAGKGGDTAAKAGPNTRYETSIITSFNAYLPFYEEVVLRRLVASGCRNNVLLIDHGHLMESLQAPSRRPRLAGRSYTLVPIQAPGVFHPKVALLVGKKRARLLVGSHNVTLSGFGGNRELSSVLDLPKGKSDSLAPAAMAAWHFLDSWLEANEHLVPPPIIEAARYIGTRYAPWLKSGKAQDGSIRFFGSSPDGPSLWEQVRPLFQTSPRRLSLIGAFFDAEHAFINTLQSELSPNEIVVGIEPETVELGTADTKVHGVRFVDASKIGRGVNYLHAKAIYAEFDSGSPLLIIGSANPSRPAWIAAATRHNAEAVLVHTDESARTSANELGLAALSDLPEVSTSSWADIRKRIKEAPPPQKKNTSNHLGYAVIEEEGVQIHVNLKEDVEVSTVRLFSQGSSSPAATVDTASKNTKGFLVATGDFSISAICYIELDLADGQMIRAYVHHPAAIAQLSRTSKQRQFRDALDALDSDSPDIPTIIRLAGKLIFEGDTSETISTENAPNKAGKENPDDSEEKPVGDLSVPVKETKTHRRRLRDLRAGDLAYIIDTLIYRLGVGLCSSAEQLESTGPTEEEQIGADDEFDEPEEALPVDVIRACHSKVRTLVSRMSKQLKRAHERKAGPMIAIEQLLAILAIVREVRAQDARLVGLTGGESLVPVLQLRKLLDVSLETLFERRLGLYTAILDEYEDDPDGDLSRLRGLLLWLAWVSEVDARREHQLGESPDVQGQRLRERTTMLLLAPLVVSDDDAVEEARRSMWRTAGMVGKQEGGLWLEEHLRWGRRLNRLFNVREVWPPLTDQPRPGDLAYAAKAPVERLRVLLRRDVSKVELADLGEPKGRIIYADSTVSLAKMPGFE